MSFFERSYKNIIKNRNAVLKMKQQSPSLKDVYRERFMARLKENRGKFVDHLRNLSSQEDVRNVICNSMSQDETGFLTNDLSNLSFSEDLLRTLDEVKTQDLTLEEEWIMHQYDCILAEEETMLISVVESSMHKDVVCPLCQKNNMCYSTDRCFITCSLCETSIPARTSLEELEGNLCSNIDIHSKNCAHKPLFSLISEDGDVYLYMLCPPCSFLNVIL